MGSKVWIGLCVAALAVAGCDSDEADTTADGGGTSAESGGGGGEMLCDEPVAAGATDGACTNDVDICIVGVESWGTEFTMILDNNLNTVGAQIFSPPFKMQAKDLRPTHNVKAISCTLLSQLQIKT